MSIWDDLKLVHLASQASFNRGFAYYQSKGILKSKNVGEGIYKGQISGSQEKIYDVTIDINHPRKSICTCPFSAGRRLICKHMVALYFFHFPEHAEAVIAEWEGQERERENRHQERQADYATFRQQRIEEVTE